MSQKPNPHVGSSFDDFLSEEGLLEVCEEQAIKEFGRTDQARHAGTGPDPDGHGGPHANEPRGFEPSVGPE